MVDLPSQVIGFLQELEDEALSRLLGADDYAYGAYNCPNSGKLVMGNVGSTTPCFVEVATLVSFTEYRSAAKNYDRLHDSYPHDQIVSAIKAYAAKRRREIR